MKVRKLITGKYIIRKKEPPLIFYYDSNGNIQTLDSKTFPYFFAPEEGIGRMISRAFQRNVFVLVEDVTQEVIPFSREPLIVDHTFAGSKYYKGKIYKISTDNPKNIPFLRDFFPFTWEADIPFVRRVAIDLKIPLLNYDPKILYFDIEVEALEERPSYQDPRHRIISIAAIGSDGREFYQDFEESGEKNLLRNFFNFASQYDIIVGYFSSIFDLPYLEARSRRLGLSKQVKFDWRIRPFHAYDFAVELESWYKQAVSQIGSMALDAVAKSVLGKEKKGHMTKDFMKRILEDRKLRQEYNVWDAQLLKELDEVFQVSTIISKIVNLGKLLDAQKIEKKYKDQPFGGIMQYIEGYLMSRFVGMHPRPILKTKDSYKKVRYPGGIDYAAEMRTWDNVWGFDFKAHYVRAIRTFNISPEIAIYTDEADRPDLIYPPGWPEYLHEFEVGKDKYAFKIKIPAFYKNRIGILPQIIKELEDLRREVKKKMAQYTPDQIEYKIRYGEQYAYKLAYLSAYGGFGSEHGRFTEYGIASAITLSARYVTLLVKHLLESLGCRTVYMVTDSIFVSVPNKVAKEFSIFELEEFINKKVQSIVSLTFGIPKHRVVFEIEASYIFEKFRTFGVKKRYYGKLIWHEGKELEEPRWVKIGVEFLKKSRSEFVKEAAEAVMQALIERGKLEALRVLDYYKNLLYSGKINEKLVMVQRLGKKLSEYKVETFLVRAIKRQGLVNKIREGDEIKFVKVADDDRLEVKIITSEEDLKNLPKSAYDTAWRELINLLREIAPELFTSQLTEFFHLST